MSVHGSCSAIKCRLLPVFNQSLSYSYWPGKSSRGERTERFETELQLWRVPSRGLISWMASSTHGGALTGSWARVFITGASSNPACWRKKLNVPARLAIMLNVYSGGRVFRGGRADKKSVHAEHLMSSTALSSPKRQLPLEMPPSAIARSQCDLTFLPKVPFMQSHSLRDSAELDGNQKQTFLMVN